MKSLLLILILLITGLMVERQLSQLVAWTGFDVVSMEAVLVNQDSIKARCSEDAVGWFDPVALEVAFQTCINVHLAQGYALLEYRIS